MNYDYVIKKGKDFVRALNIPGKTRYTGDPTKAATFCSHNGAQQFAKWDEKVVMIEWKEESEK